MDREDRRVSAVVFDWGGTLTPWHTVDLADLWSVAARILAPEHAEELTAALLAVEREAWEQVQRSAGHSSATLDDLLALATERTGVHVEEALRERALVAHLHDDVAFVAGKQVNVLPDAPHVHLAIPRCRVDGTTRHGGSA